MLHLGDYRIRISNATTDSAEEFLMGFGADSSLNHSVLPMHRESPEKGYLHER